MSESFTLVFAIFLLAGLVLRLWLTTRHMRHIAQHSGAVPPAFAQTITLAAHQKAGQYSISNLRLGLVELFIGSALLLGWTLFGGLQWFNTTLLQWLAPGLWQQMALVVAFVAISSLLDLPLSLYKTFVLEQKFGFNKTTFALWLADSVKGLLLGALLGLPLLALLLWLMAQAGQWWWLYAWGALLAFQLIMMVIAPLWIAPLFNKFQPLEDESLKQRALALMQQAGLRAQGFFIMDGSRRSAHSNAYFTGIGRAKRVVFYDTLLAKLNPGEVDAVLAHELGHFKHGHIRKRIVLLFVLSFLGLALLGWLSQQTWFYDGLGVQAFINADGSVSVGENAGMALLLFSLALPVFLFFISPVFAYFSRRDEFEADRYAVSVTQAQDLGAALLKLYNDNAATLTPDPWYVRFYYSHPPALQRFAAMGYDPI